MTDVTVYSNCPRVSLTVNGAAQPEVAADAVRVFRWKGVRLSTGENVVEASCGGRGPRDTVHWTVAGTQ